MNKEPESVNFASWIGRNSSFEDRIDLALSQRIAITLADNGAPKELRAGDSLPPLWHWCFFQTPQTSSNLSKDGHPKRGGFLPPIALPRRMRAAGSLRFHEPLHIGATITRESSIESIEEKQGRSGCLVFVKVSHRYTYKDTLFIEERQDLVFREAAKQLTSEQSASHQAEKKISRAAAERSESAEESESDELSKKIVPSEVKLFRYSALTFNSHRIHYDRDYAKNVEGYDGLVVHGPLLATQLCEFASGLIDADSSQLQSFDFRAQQATLDQGAYYLRATKPVHNGKTSKIDLRVINQAGAQSMIATALFRSKRS